MSSVNAAHLGIAQEKYTLRSAAGLHHRTYECVSLSVEHEDSSTWKFFIPFEPS